MTILENNCMQSTASSAGYSTGGTLISAFAACDAHRATRHVLPLMLGWVFLLAVLGVTMAMPMKRQMINIEQLRFPSGIAAAETLRALHSVGSQGMRSARALAWAGLLALVGSCGRDGLVLVSAKLGPYMIGSWMAALNQRLFGPVWIGRTVMISWEPDVHRGRRHHGFPGGLEHAARSVIGWMIFVPTLQAGGLTEGAGFATLVQWTLWGGVACMVSASLALLRPAVARPSCGAFTDLGAMVGAAVGPPMIPWRPSRSPPPGSWGQLIGLVGLAWLGHRTFGIPYWQIAVAVLLLVRAGAGGLPRAPARPTPRRSAPWARSPSSPSG